MTVADRQRTLCESLLFLPDAQERLSHLVTEAAKSPVLPLEDRVPDYRVPGCVSQVWLRPEFRGGRCYFRSAADSPLVAGLVHLLCRIYDGAEPHDILRTEPAVLEEAGIWRNLSPTRQTGLQAVRRCMAEFARRFAGEAAEPSSFGE